MWIITLIGIYGLGYIGYKVSQLLRIPSPALIGPMFSVGIVTSFGVSWAGMPIYINVIMQIIIGIMIGLRFSRDKLKDLKSLIIPGSLITSWLLISGIGTGLFLYYILKIDLGTALFSAAPAGIVEMCAFALSYNLNVSVVIMFQLLRVIGVYITIPAFASKYHKNENFKISQKEISCGKEDDEKDKSIYLTTISGAIAGFGVWYLNVPGGAIIGPLIVVGILRCIDLPLKSLPSKVIVLAQIVLGGTLGLSFSPDVFHTLSKMLMPALLFSIAIVTSSIILGFVVHKFFGWDIATSLLSCAPAGLSQMSVIALEMNADPIKVGLMHVIRLTVIDLVIPPFILWMLT